MTKKEFIIESYSADEGDILICKLPKDWLPPIPIKKELIRCKDCKHYWESAKMCTNTGTPLNDYCEPIDFCSKAERKEE